jgi:hypothetical protein
VRKAPRKHKQAHTPDAVIAAMQSPISCGPPPRDWR